MEFLQPIGPGLVDGLPRLFPEPVERRAADTLMSHRYWRGLMNFSQNDGYFSASITHCPGVLRQIALRAPLREDLWRRDVGVR